VKTRLEVPEIRRGLAGQRLPDGSPPLPLEPGEIVLLLTDGIVEAPWSDENLFGTERALRLVKNHGTSRTGDLNALFGGFRTSAVLRPSLDDMTAIVIKAGAPAAPGGREPAPAH